MASHTFVLFSSWISSSPNRICAMWPYFANYIIINRLFRAASKQRNEWNAHGSHRKHKLSTINHTDIKYHHLKCAMWSGKNTTVSHQIFQIPKKMRFHYMKHSVRKNQCVFVFFCTKLLRLGQQNLICWKWKTQELMCRWRDF